MGHYAKRFFNQGGIVRDGLKLWLDASRPDSYSGSGTTWYDLSGNGNDGILVNGVAFDSVNKVMSFDGVNDYVIGSNPIRNIGFSISFYVLAITTKISGLFVSRISTGSGLSAFLIMANGLKIRFDTGGDLWQPNYNLPLNEFKQITLTATSTEKKIYVNGELFQSKTGAFGVDPTNSYTIGASNLNGWGSNYLHGKINDMMLYNKVLSDSEISQNFNATRNKYGL